nr:DDRGK domain-containing protein 1 [Onthophagus taurus]
MLIYGILLSVLILILSIIFYLRSSTPTKNNQENRPRPVPNRLRDGAPRRAQMARNRGARLRANTQQQEDEVSDNELEVDDEEKIDLPEGKIGAKKMAKLQAKAEKKAQREADEQMRQEKKKKDQQALEEKKKQDEKEKAEELKREEEEKLAREEKERKEYEEYLKMKEAFTVDEEGCEHEEDEQNLLQEFVGYIKSQKVVVIEDLAAKFRLKTQAAIDRLKDLQADDILTGVIDDRGKFIYVSQEEMDAVAKFIRQRGRVSITELAENSNQLINLIPTTQVT